MRGSSVTSIIHTSILGYLRELESLSLPREGAAAVGSPHWMPPADSWVRVNFDAGFYADLQAASAGIVVRNDIGLFMGSTCFWENHVPCLLFAEALACVKAIQFVQDLGFHWVEFEGDSLILISRLRGAQLDRSKVRARLREA